MKAAVLHRYDEKLTAKEFVSYEDVVDPRIERPTDVIVRIGGAGVCRTDLHVVEGIWRDKSNVNLPYILGHENAGWVEEVGKEVEGVKKGDPVIVHPKITGGTCLACRRGFDMHGPGAFPGLDCNGGYAEFLCTSERNIVALPRSLARAVRAQQRSTWISPWISRPFSFQSNSMDLANSTLQTALLLARKFDSYIEGAPARSCIALSLSIRSQPVAGTRIARQSDQGVSDALTQISYR